MTVRMSQDSWFKVQSGRSQGQLSNEIRSEDGGFGFSSPDASSFTDADAMAYRADISVGLHDVFDSRSGRVTLYMQNLDSGYSAPGQATLKDTRFYGGTIKMPVTKQISLNMKGDQRIEDQGLETRAVELNVGYKLAERWSIST